MVASTLLSEFIKYFSRGWIPNDLLGILYMRFIYTFGSLNKSLQTLRLNFLVYFSSIYLNIESKILYMFQHVSITAIY